MNTPFDRIEHFSRLTTSMRIDRSSESKRFRGVNRTVEVLIQGESVVFSWNDPDIKEMASELGEPEFAEPRPCG